MASNYNLTQPYMFCKLDIKDGFQRIFVDKNEKWNFCYIISATSTPENIDNTQILVPNSLQMG